MDYTRQSLPFKIKKALRYVGLYGPRRTLAKIQGQRHMQRAYTSLPKPRDRFHPGAHVGLIGCGNFQYSTVAYYLTKNYGAVLQGVMDCNLHRAASLFERYGANYYTDDANRLLDDPAIDLVFIASNHASHAEYAIQALQCGKHVHIEKPHVVRDDQLVRLCRAMEAATGKVGLGFNRPGSRIGRSIKAALDSQTGPAMLNWFVAGHAIPPDHWYFSKEEGGRVLGNLCHWTDFVYQMVPPAARYPILITPTRSEKSDCDIAVAYRFGDGTIAMITFSAKGHTFEGVKERLAAHRGNVLIAMDDFQSVVIEEREKKQRLKLFFRDHGHEERIRQSYRMAVPGANSAGCALSYVWETGELFLRTRQALEQNRQVTLHPFDAASLGNVAAAEHSLVG